MTVSYLELKWRCGKSQQVDDTSRGHALRSGERELTVLFPGLSTGFTLPEWCGAHAERATNWALATRVSGA
jgi:hypothetical protein